MRDFFELLCCEIWANGKGIAMPYKGLHVAVGGLRCVF